MSVNYDLSHLKVADEITYNFYLDIKEENNHMKKFQISVEKKRKNKMAVMWWLCAATLALLSGGRPLRVLGSFSSVISKNTHFQLLLLNAHKSAAKNYTFLTQNTSFKS